MKIAVTMRVLEMENRGEVWDCVDQKWEVQLNNLGLQALFIPNTTENVGEFVSRNNIEGFVLTGGNDLSHLDGAVKASVRRDILERAILDFASQNHLPIFAVCRGMQLLNFHLGGKITRVFGHDGICHKIHEVSKSTPEISEIEVNCYHNWGITQDSLGAGVTPIYLANDGTVEAISVDDLPWTGVMWHPEREPVFPDSALNLLKYVFPAAGRIGI
jgi:gamma-glutamyl-gamma-aminobutyrate hydrolase PuuD